MPSLLGSPRVGVSDRDGQAHSDSQRQISRGTPHAEEAKSDRSRSQRPMIIGFTGTRQGLTPAQMVTLRAEFETIEPNRQHTLVHGGAVGADEIAHRIARMLGWGVEIFPATGSHGTFHGGRIHLPRLPLERNRLIVSMVECLFATPSGPEVQRSGTWSTIRYARKCERPGRIIWPDGSTSTL